MLNKQFPLCHGKDRLSCPISKVKGTSTEIIEIITLEQLFADMLTDDVADIERADALTHAYKTPQYDQLKNQLNGFVIGQFSKREDAACEVCVPLLVFDIDKIEDVLFTSWLLYALQQNPYVFAAFPSVSGHGLRIFVWSDASRDNRKEAYEAFCDYLSAWLNIETDKQLRKRLKNEGIEDDFSIARIDTGTRNISRHWYYKPLTKDQFYLNLESQVFSIDQSPKNVQQVYLASSKVLEMRMNEAEKIEACVQIVNGRNIPNGRNNFVFILACCLNEHGVSPDAILNHCLSYIETGFSEAEIKRTVESALKRTQPTFADEQLQKYLNSSKNEPSKTKQLKADTPSVSDGKNEENKAFDDDFKANKFISVKNYLLKRYDFRRNIVAMEVELSPKDKKEFTVLNDNDLVCELMEAGFSNIADMTAVFIRSTRYVPNYDPFEEYFKNLPSWDASMPDYIEHLANFVIAKDQNWFNYHFKKTLVRVVACALTRIPFNKQCFTIVGKQNDGKTSFIRFLCPPLLKNYLKEDLDIHNKDGRLTLAQNFIINFDELATFSRFDINKIKSFFTIDKVKERLPYDRVSMNFPRRSSFFASTNSSEFLTDETGSVRWLVLESEGIKHDNGGAEGYSKNVDINLVWAQAYALLNADFVFQLTPEDIKKSETNNIRFSKTTYEEELIMQRFTPSVKTETDAQFFTVTAIREAIESENQSRKLSHEQLGRALTKLGFEKGSQYNTKSKFTEKGYWIKKI